MGDPIEIRKVVSREDLHQFIYLPQAVHRQQPDWVPPFFDDEKAFFNPKLNSAFKKNEASLWNAYRFNRPVGRIMGIIPHEYNQLTNDSCARFFALECINDPDISHLLMSTVEEWACEKGLKKIIGPFGFSDKDPQGLQIEGFDHLPVIATATNLPYLKTLVESEGYQKEFDCVVYQMEVPYTIPPLYKKIAERVLKSGLTLHEFSSRKELKPFIVPVLRAVNEIYKSIYGFIPLSEKEMKELAKRYLPLLDPAFSKVITDKNNNPVAFIVASPDISKGLIRSKGRLFPLGFLYILLSAQFTDQLDLFLGGVTEEYRNTGITAVLGTSLFQSAHKRNLKYIDSHLILESNLAMRAMMERWNAKVYKRYRVYSKIL